MLGFDPTGGVADQGGHVCDLEFLFDAAPVHINGGIANASLLEVHPPFERNIHPALKNPLTVEDGHVAMPQGPGLSVDLDWDIIEAETEEVI